MASIVIMDPITRIEGHLKVEIAIDQGVITDARCTGTLFRGFEMILKGRDPWDAPVLTQRICGVCPVSHGVASVKALEAAEGRSTTGNGRILRNLIQASNFLQSHILHFYFLAAMDYARGPQTAPWTPAWEVDIRSGSEAIAAHLPNAVTARRISHEMGAIFAGRMPMGNAIVPGGVTCVPASDTIILFRYKLNQLINFIQNTYIPDVELLGQLYADYFSIGAGHGNLLAYGGFDLDDFGSTMLLKRGYIETDNPSMVRDTQPGNIAESVAYSWYDNATTGLNPADGRTQPVHPRSKADAYSWLKAPRYNGKPFEAGPLARMCVSGEYQYSTSVMDRNRARAYEALKIAQAMNGWLNELAPGAPVHNTGHTDAPNASGIGLTEAPRGALGHWISIAAGKISQYQVVTPTCWNTSPRDENGVPGPMEQALIGTSVQDPTQPIEALRIVHSFDPCMSCAVHIMKPKGEPTVVSMPAV